MYIGKKTLEEEKANIEITKEIETSEAILYFARLFYL